MGQRYALLIGNSNYQAGFLPLAAPKRDVKALEKVLRDPNIGGFDEVLSLFNLTCGEMRKYLEPFFRDRESDDLLLFYFSGHGERDPDELKEHLYLIGTDTEKIKMRLVKGSSLSADFITDLMQASASKQQIIVLDCCHGVAFGSPKGSPYISEDAPQFLSRGEGKIVLYASGSLSTAV